jgi:hypothetical protein
MAGQPDVAVSVGVNPPRKLKDVTVLMITNSHSPANRCRLSRLEGVSGDVDPPANIDGYFACVIDFGHGGIRWYDFFNVSYVQQTNAHIYGHLPAIGTLDQSLGGYAASPAVAVQSYKNAPYTIRNIVLNSSGDPGKQFYIPAKLTIEENLPDLAAMIAKQQVNYMIPAGKASGPDYFWQGYTYLEPIFKATNDDALQSESDSAFLSGVLFGIAGAAAIAFVQEIPETFDKPVWWSRRKRRRKASSQNPADGKPDSTAGKEQPADVKTSSEVARPSTGLGWPASD